MTLTTRTLWLLEKQVTAMVQDKMAMYEDMELLILAEFIFGSDNEVLIAYREEIKKEFGAPRITSEPIVFMGKKVE